MLIRMYVCMFVLCVKFQKPNFNDSSFIVIKLNAKHIIRTTILLFYILQNRNRNRCRIFSDSVLPLSHLRARNEVELAAFPHHKLVCPSCYYNSFTKQRSAVSG
jgi:hypothetical protein